MRMTLFQIHLRFALMGMLMGITLSHIGFTNYSELHRMFLFQDLRMLFTFAGAVAFAMLFFNVLIEGMPPSRKHFHPGVVPGGMLFGAGWALSGSCPSIALVQLGEGKLAAIFTVIGIGFGVWLYPHVHRMFFHWDSGTCS
jgi:hypothetical protein